MDSDNVNIGAYLGVVFVFLFVGSIFLVWYYAEKGFPWHTYVTCVIGYFCAFGVLLLVPVDIGSIVVDRRVTSNGSNAGYDSDVSTLTTAYTAFYSIILVLCGFVMVFEEYYNTDGYFTVAWKLLSSFLRMCRDTVLAVIVGCILLGIFVGEKIIPLDESAILLVTVVVTNTMYEAFLMFLLGYGLVAFPMLLWSNSDIESQLKRIQNRVAGEFKGLSESSLLVSLAVSDVYKTREMLAGYGDQSLRDAIEVLVADCPSEFKSSTIGTVAANKEGKITIHSLAALRTRLNIFKDRFRMSQNHLEKVKRLAYTLEDIAIASRKKDGTKTIFWTLYNKESTEREFTWYVTTKPVLYKIGAFTTAVLSLFSFLGVIGCMHNIDPNVSVYFLAVHDESASGAGIVIFILITLGYAAYVALFSLFEMRMAGIMELVPNSTTPESLSFNVRMCARLASPLAFFYLGWLFESGIKSGPWQYDLGSTDPIKMPSAFSQFYKIQVIPFLGDTFGTVFPIMLFSVCFLVLTNLLNRIFVLLHLESFQFGQEVVTEEQLKEGKRQLDRHKKSTARTVQRESLRARLGEIAKSDKTGVVAFLWENVNRGAAGKKTRDVDQDAEAAETLREPAALSGMVERKGAKNSFGLETGWKDEFAIVKSPGVLGFYKEFKKANSGFPGDFEVDLKLLLSFNEVSLGSKGHSLELEMPDTTVRLRFNTKEDAINWRTALQLWKDFAIDYSASNKGNPRPDEENVTVSALHSKKETGAKGKKDDYGLDSIEIGEYADSDNDSPKAKGGGLLSFTRGLFKGKKEENIDSALDNIEVGETAPGALEGWLEKKTASKLHLGGAGDWERKYCAVDEDSASLNFYKTDRKNRSEAAGSIDLKLISDISLYFEKKGNVTSRFNVTVGDKVFKFKAESEADRDRWMEGLTEWKDYALLHLTGQGKL